MFLKNIGNVFKVVLFVRGSPEGGYRYVDRAPHYDEYEQERQYRVILCTSFRFQPLSPILGQCETCIVWLP